MKKTYYFLCLLIAFGISVRTSAQTDPGLTNLTHQWTFDDGTAKDLVGTADGTLQGAATLTNKALVTSGGYMSFDAAKIGINTYSELTAEVWFTSASAGNVGYYMISYFGNTSGTVGANYFSMTPTRGDNVSRASISCLNTSSPWATETGVNGTKYDDGKLHHLVATVNATNITFYIDGANVGTAVLSTDNHIANIGTQFAYLAKGGYSNDPTWKGSIHKYSIYNKALSDQEVLFLFQKGAESQSVINSTASSLVFDNTYNAEVFSVSSLNLSSNITVTAPAGITLMNSKGNIVTSIAANTADNSITAIYDMSTSVNGNITLTSGATVVNIPVKTASDVACFVPLYPALPNLIQSTGVDVGMTSLSGYGGWGYKDVATIISDPTNVYCGAGSIQVGNGTSTGSGSLDVSMNGLLAPNTSYHVKVMIKTIGGSFHLGVDAAPNVEKAIDTNGAWMPLEFSFVTGSSWTSGVMYINNYATTGLKAYVDNYELYQVSDPIITVSTNSYVADNKSGKNFKITCKGTNLTKNITITAPAGITVSPSVISKDSITTQTFTATYDGTTAVNGNIVLNSDTLNVKIAVKSELGDVACFTPLYSDKVNMVADPYMNNISTFGGWGSKTSITNVDSVYCGSHSGLIAGGAGSIDVNVPGKLTPNSIYIARAMVRTIGKFQMGIYGQGNPEFADSINTHGAWQVVTFQFNTGATPSATAAGLYFNNSLSNGGTRGYIDNWELYKKDTISAVANVRDQFQNIFVQNGKLVADFDADNSSVAQLAVYNVQGALISDEKFASVVGRNRIVLTATLPSGMYIVRLTQNGQNRYTKLIK